MNEYEVDTLDQYGEIARGVSWKMSGCPDYGSNLYRDTALKILEERVSLYRSMRPKSLVVEASFTHSAHDITGQQSESKPYIERLSVNMITDSLRKKGLNVVAGTDSSGAARLVVQGKWHDTSERYSPFGIRGSANGIVVTAGSAVFGRISLEIPGYPAYRRKFWGEKKAPNSIVPPGPGAGYDQALGNGLQHAIDSLLSDIYGKE